MGCGASGKYTASDPVNKLVFVTQVPESQARHDLVLDVDKELLDELFHEKSDGLPVSPKTAGIPATEVEELLKEYARKHRKQIQDASKRSIHLSDCDVTASLAMEQLEEFAQQIAEEILESLKVGLDGALTRDQFGEELKKIVCKLQTNIDSRSPSKRSGIGSGVQVDRQLLTELWDKYDADGNGDWTVEEMKALLMDYVEGTKTRLSETHMTKRGNIIQSYEYKKTMKIMEHLDQNSDKFAELLKKTVDTNNDGAVEKDEFLAKFPEGWTHVLESAQYACRKDIQNMRNGSKGNRDRLNTA